LLGSDGACKIVGMGTIRIRINDEIMRTLNNVRHILDLKKNLISLGTLYSLGYKYSGEGGFIRVSKGPLVMMQGNKVDGHYFLWGSTVVGLVDVSLDTTQLWHMWLGHSKEVELHVEDSERVQDGTQVQPILDSHGSDFDDDPQEEKRPVLLLVDRGGRLGYLRDMAM
jgi:hypothetical protein